MEVSGRSAPIVYTGLREGEKLHEELFGPGELDLRPSHPSISQVVVPPLDPAYLLSLAVDYGEIEVMTECATGTVPQPRTAHTDESVTL
jgi:FlaA1/EpsC-like NDP-sugar epimerase